MSAPGPEPGPGPEYGSLRISKTVVGAPSNAQNKTYTFTVSGPNGYKRTVSVKANGSVILSNLTPGAYTVTEENAGIDGYTLSVDGTGSVEVKANKTETVTVTNTYEPKAPEQHEKPEDPEDPPLTDIPEEEPLCRAKFLSMKSFPGDGSPSGA